MLNVFRLNSQVKGRILLESLYKGESAEKLYMQVKTPTLKFPGLPLFFFGNLFHVFIVYVVLTNEAVYSTI